MRTTCALLLISALLGAGPAFGANCMRSDGVDQHIQGRLRIGRFKDAADRPESAYILTLSKPACLAGDAPDTRVSATRTIHIYATKKAIQDGIKRAVGKSISVWGRPFAAHTAHHHAPIVMEITRLDPQQE